ncbi:uncharacterized protein (TIGR02001 family) [Tibeticola sediminis]|jgi:uncharacterized protein (TIGR02001 family)|uniref:Uncharacterized protein (TIGR02001 family) n=1 Tax=Tibeticola sediminis TaxID=1917811 RepID=A0A3N4UQH7_9BURK|nr:MULTISPECIES: TorF family putative porin [Tibeticola]MCI4439623.1 hypothetical protein [Tibeticola sp.]RPE72328.1 uncharacterized protein (TIGR02001 family) [Tibeticola sediminis]
MMQRTLPLVLASAATLLAATPAFAQATAPAPEYTLGYNVGVVTDYRYRGISQSRLDPALQGGIDFSHKSGFYVGAWASTIKWIKDAGASKGSMELDLYAGYKGEIAKDLGFDVGYLRYEYPSNKLKDVTGANANTDELYGALTYGMFTAKYSHSVSNLFGTPNSKNSGYLDLSAAVDLGNGMTLTPHVGHQRIKNFSAGSYTDWSLTLAKDFGNGLTGTVAAVGTDADKTVYFTPSGKFTGRNALVLGLKYSF